MAKSKKTHQFKVKDMRMYYSLDSLYHNRKYRTVFASGEVDYLRCDLQLYNILFDEEDWKSKYVNETVPKDFMYTDDDGITWQGYCGESSSDQPA